MKKIDIVKNSMSFDARFFSKFRSIKFELNFTSDHFSFLSHFNKNNNEKKKKKKKKKTPLIKI